MSGTDHPLLEVRDLELDLPTTDGATRVLDGVSFTVAPGEIVGLVGESGSGKTMTALAVLGLLPNRHAQIRGQILFDGVDLLGLSAEALRQVRGRDIGMVFQEPSTSLHPSLTVGRQVAEVLPAHQPIKRHEAGDRAVELLRDVRIPDATRRAGMYPFELSGGMQQRVLIASALAGGARLLLADEPTTALDVTVQAQILDLLADERRRRDLAIVFVTHDLSLVRHFCDRVMVMYAGQIVEDRPTADLLADPRHPYAQALLRAVPHAVPTGHRLPVIPPAGDIPTTGCRFAPRCPHRRDRCVAATPVLVSDTTGRHRCIRADELDDDMPDELDDPIALPEPSPDVLLHVHGLRREFAGRRRLGRAAPAAVAVDEIDLQVRAGETLALVGESGSGKSTTARMVLRLLDATGGQIVWAGTDISRLRGRPLRRVRADLQAVFQDPTGSLDPTMTIGKHLVAAVRLHRGGSRADARARAAELVGLVGLRAAHLDRYPSELSGGQRQRVVLARALAAQPRLIVLDEPVSSLDVSTQSQAVNLLADLQRELGLAYLLIAHDLPLVRHLSHRVAVMYLGTIVEEGPTEQIFDRPRHPYTQALLSLVPTIEGQGRPPIVLPGEMPPPTAIPSGCRFRTRCPYVFDVCLDDPPMMTFADTGRTACHLHTSEPWLAGATVHGLLDEHGQPDSAEPSDHESTLAREA